MIDRTEAPITKGMRDTLIRLLEKGEMPVSNRNTDYWVSSQTAKALYDQDLVLYRTPIARYDKIKLTRKGESIARRMKR